MRIQYRRMINYSVRRYQNQLISRVMQNEGPTGLPARLAQLYSAHLPSFTIRPSPALAWFDYQALRRIRRAAEFSQTRSEERRVGTGVVRRCRSRWLPSHKKKN